MTTSSLHYCIPRDKLTVLHKFKEIVGPKGESKTIVKLMEDFVRDYEGKPKETPKNLMPPLETLIGDAEEWNEYLSGLFIDETMRLQGFFKKGYDLSVKYWKEKKHAQLRRKSGLEELGEAVGAS